MIVPFGTPAERSFVPGTRRQTAFEHSKNDSNVGLEANHDALDKGTVNELSRVSP